MDASFEYQTAIVRQGLARCLTAGLILVLAPALHGAESAPHLIEGRIFVGDALASTIEPDDRLIIRLYYPHEGVDKDETFRIAKEFTLPLDFKIGPALDMSRRTKWPAYMVEVFLDKDHDIPSKIPGELRAHSGELVPLGTTDLTLELAE